MNRFAKAIAGLIGVCVLTLLALAISSRIITAQDATLSNEAQPENGRFQISAWAYTGSSNHGPTNGAYIIDTRTGKVWAVGSTNKIVAVGSVEN
ncbi:hypothetical protein SH449x_004721 [Pirellulaceae bacterium SH449]